MIHALKQRLGNRPDTEHGQAIVRMVLIVLILGYVLLPGPRHDLPHHQYQVVLGIVLTGLTLSVLLFAWLLARPGRSDPRRVAGMLADYGLIAAGMVQMGEPLAWVYIVVMWVTVGNGMRYGNKYLYAAVGMALVSFGVTVLGTGYWQANARLGFGLWLGLAAVPLYFATLLRQLTHAMDEARRTHLVVEAMRRAYRDRTFFLGDPDFVQIPQKVLTSRDYAQGLRATIHPDKATPSDLLSGNPTPLEDDETTHFSIIDQDGNRVGATQTVNLLYGSGLIPSGTGVLLNNEMDDFALKPGTPNAFGVMGYAANAPKPGKRMLSSMTPTFMESADKVVVLGTPGGSRIITMVLLGVLGYDDGLDAQQVAALPRFHHQWLPDVIEAESNSFDEATIKQLQAMGHKIDLPGNTAAGGRGSSHVWGNLQTVEWNRRSNQLSVGSDPRNPVGSGAISP